MHRFTRRILGLNGPFILIIDRFLARDFINEPAEVFRSLFYGTPIVL
jgi:hypothetical protein